MDNQQFSEYELIQKRFRITTVAALLVLSVGAVFYHLVEKLNWLDSVYFSVVTLATVGYGDITPKTNPGKVFTIGYILVGIGIIATFANLMVRRAAIRHERRHPSAKQPKE